MGSVKKGKVISFIMPSEWQIQIKKHDGFYMLDYTEIVERPADMDREEFLKCVENTIEYCKKLFQTANVKSEIETSSYDDKITIRLKLESSLEIILSALVSEFIGFAKIGDITLRELLVLTSIAFRTLKGQNTQNHT